MGLVVKAADARLSGFCARGAVAAVKQVGLDHRAFVKTGLPIEQIEAVDDVQFQLVAAAVRERDGEE